MIYLVSLVYLLILIYTIKISTRSIHMLQQNLYNENNRYVKWVFNNLDQSLLNINLYGIVFSIIIFFSKVAKIDILLLIIIGSVYVVSLVKDNDLIKKGQNKKPLVVTKRVKRLIFTLSLVYLIPVVLLYFRTDLRDVITLILSVLVSLNFFVVFLVNIINYPLERIIYHYYERQCKNKLKSMKSLKIIGITGSYGKTSSKNILNDVLNIRYNSFPTPKSINTFNGIMITVNNKMTKFEDIFICEMGAYVKGEINRLCKLVNPKYAIITSIGTAHLESFGSEENILNGKMELVEYLPEDGIAVLNYDDLKQRNYKIKKENHAKILWIGIDNKDLDVCAQNIKCSNKGTSFDVYFKGDKNKYSFETRLLGRHNVHNILQAIALGKEFGLTIKELQDGVRRVQPVEHRLEIREFPNFYQIDDAYNSNPVGAKNALEVLSLMPGDKVVVTPGMIELGDKEEELNKEFGKQIAHSSDKVILIGEKRTKPIYDRLIEEKFNKDNIYVLNDVRESYTLLKDLKRNKDLYALFENDLPDTYTEIGGKK